MDTETLIKNCKKMMVDLGLDAMGCRPILAMEISTPDDKVNSKSLTMALTGYRNGPRYGQIIDRLNEYLRNRLYLRATATSGVDVDSLPVEP